MEIALLDDGGAESGALSLEPDLLALVEAWPTLPEPIKAAIRAMVDHAHSRR